MQMKKLHNWHLQTQLFQKKAQQPPRLLRLREKLLIKHWEHSKMPLRNVQTKNKELCVVQVVQQLILELLPQQMHTMSLLNTLILKQMKMKQLLLRELMKLKHSCKRHQTPERPSRKILLQLLCKRRKPLLPSLRTELYPVSKML